MIFSSLLSSSLLFFSLLFCFVMFYSVLLRCSVHCPYSSPMPSFSPVSSFLIFSSPLFIHLSALLPHPHPLLSSPFLFSHLYQLRVMQSHVGDDVTLKYIQICLCSTVQNSGVQHTSVRVSVPVSMCVYVNVCMCVCIYVNMCAYIYLYTCVCVCVCVYVCMYVCVCIRVCDRGEN